MVSSRIKGKEVRKKQQQQQKTNEKNSKTCLILLVRDIPYHYIPGLVNSSFDFISNIDNRAVTRGSRVSTSGIVFK